MTAADDDAAWRSYLVPGTDTLRTLPGFTDPTAAALYERITSANAETELRRTTDRPRTLDLDHLCDIHGRVFSDVYDWAGQLRYVDIGKPGQTGEPFIHHEWIRAFAAAGTEQLRAEQNLATVADPGNWADRAAHQWHAVLHLHPFREGNGRTARLFLEDLAAEAGHSLDWSRSSPERNVFVAVAAGHGDLEPMRALLTQVAGGTVGMDRPIDALDDLHKLQHSLSWARTGQTFGTEEDRARLHQQVPELAARISNVLTYLDSQPVRAATREQPAEQRWRGLAASINPAIPQTDDWPTFAADMDTAAAAGVDVAAELHRITADITNKPIRPASEPAAARPAPRREPEPQSPPLPRPPELAAAGYQRPPTPGPRR